MHPAMLLFIIDISYVTPWIMFMLTLSGVTMPILCWFKSNSQCFASVIHFNTYTELLFMKFSVSLLLPFLTLWLYIIL
jgi:hypothetical protein